MKFGQIYSPDAAPAPVESLLPVLCKPWKANLPVYANRGMQAERGQAKQWLEGQAVSLLDW